MSPGNIEGELNASYENLGKPMKANLIGVATTLIELGAAFAVMSALVGLAWIITRAIHIYHALTFFVNGDCPDCKDRER